MSASSEIVRACARPALAPGIAARLDGLLGSAVDWPGVLRLAERHGLLPLVHHHLASRGAAVPASVSDELRSRARAVTGHNLMLTGELLRIVDRLQSQGIPVIPYKGPLLGLIAYGSLALRSFADLDLLIPRADVLEAKRLLLDDGYQPIYRLGPAEEAAYLRSECEYMLERGPLRVELHWQILPRYFSVPLDMDGFWTRTTVASLAGATVRTLAPEDLLLALSAHATKHCWDRLELVASFAAVARRHPGIDWTALREAAARAGARRLLDVSLWLARELIELELPPAVMDDRVAGALAHEVAGRLLAEDPEVLDWKEQVRFHLRARERSSDRLRYVMRLATTQTVDDWQLVALPSRAGGLYRVIRPLRLLGKFGPLAVARMLSALAEGRDGQERSA